MIKSGVTSLLSSSKDITAADQPGSHVHRSCSSLVLEVMGSTSGRRTTPISRSTDRVDGVHRFEAQTETQFGNSIWQSNLRLENTIWKSDVKIWFETPKSDMINETPKSDMRYENPIWNAKIRYESRKSDLKRENPIWEMRMRKTQKCPSRPPYYMTANFR